MTTTGSGGLLSLTHVTTPIATSTTKRLLFDHLPKSGGTSVKKYLEVMIGKPVAHHPGKRQLSDQQWVLLTEFDSLLPAERNAFFTLGLIREPCSYYVSLWTFGSDGHGQMRHVLAQANHSDLYGRTSPYLDDLDRFTRWLQMEKGVLTRRLKQSYGNPVARGNVDCWMHTEHLVDDFNECMVQFRRQGGWTRHTTLPTENQAIANPSTHVACDDYFNTERADIVMHSDAAIFREFGYPKCCHPDYKGLQP